MADIKLIGAVGVKVRPDTRGFGEETERGVRRELADVDPKINVEAKPDLDKTAMTKVMAEAKRQAAEGAKLPVNPELQRKDLQRELDKMKDLQSLRIKVKITPEGMDKSTEGAIIRFSKSLQEALRPLREELGLLNEQARFLKDKNTVVPANWFRDMMRASKDVKALRREMVEAAKDHKAMAEEFKTDIVDAGFQDHQKLIDKNKADLETVKQLAGQYDAMIDDLDKKVKEGNSGVLGPIADFADRLNLKETLDRLRDQRDQLEKFLVQRDRFVKKDAEGKIIDASEWQALLEQFTDDDNLKLAQDRLNEMAKMEEEAKWLREQSVYHLEQYARAFPDTYRGIFAAEAAAFRRRQGVVDKALANQRRQNREMSDYYDDAVRSAKEYFAESGLVELESEVRMRRATAEYARFSKMLYTDLLDAQGADDDPISEAMRLRVVDKREREIKEQTQLIDKLSLSQLRSLRWQVLDNDLASDALATAIRLRIERERLDQQGRQRFGSENANRADQLRDNGRIELERIEQEAYRQAARDNGRFRAIRQRMYDNLFSSVDMAEMTKLFERTLAGDVKARLRWAEESRTITDDAVKEIKEAGNRLRLAIVRAADEAANAPSLADTWRKALAGDAQARLAFQRDIRDLSSDMVEEVKDLGNALRLADLAAADDFDTSKLREAWLRSLTGDKTQKARFAELSVGVSKESIERAKHEAQELKDKIDAMEAEIEVNPTGLALTAARFQFLTRPRTVNILAKVNEKSFAIAEGALLSLAGLNVAQDIGRKFESIFTNFDTWALRVGKISVIVGNVANVVGSLTSSLLGIGEGVLDVVGLLTLAPTALFSAAAGFSVFSMAYSNFAQAFSDIPVVAKDALAKLPPLARKAVESLRGTFRDLADPVQEAYWKEMGDSISRLKDRLIPGVKEGLVQIAPAAGRLTKGILDSFIKLADQGQLKDMFTNISLMFDNLSGAAQPFFDAFNLLGLRGSAYLPMFGTWITDIANQFDRWVRTAAKTGDIDRWIQDGVQSLQDMWDIGDSVIDMFRGLTSAASDAGAPSLTDFARGMDKIAASMNQEPFRSRMGDLFDGMREGASALWDGVERLGDVLGRTSGFWRDFLDVTGQIGGQWLINLASALSNTRLQSGVLDSFSGLLELSKELNPVFEDLGTIIGDIGTLSGNAFRTLAPVFSSIITGVSRMMQELAGPLSKLSPLLTKQLAGSLTTLGNVLGSVAKIAADGLEIFDSWPGVLKSVAIAAGAFLLLRGALGKTMAALLATAPFARMRKEWATQQALAGKTAEEIKKVGTNGMLMGLAATEARKLGGDVTNTRTRFRELGAAAKVVGQDTVRAFGQLPPIMQRFGQFAGRAFSDVRLGARTLGQDTLRSMTVATGAVTRFGQGMGNVMQSVLARPIAQAAEFRTKMTTAFGYVGGKASAAFAPISRFAQTATGHVSALATAAVNAGKAMTGPLRRAGAGLVEALGGGWGIAIMGAVVALGLLAQKQAEAAAKAQQLRDTLDQVTGAATDATNAFLKAEIMNQRQDGFLWMGNDTREIETLRELKLGVDDVIKATTDGGPAFDGMVGKLSSLADALHAAGPQFDAYGNETAGSREELNAWEQEMGYAAGAVNTTEVKVRNLISFMQNNRGTISTTGDELRWVADQAEGAKPVIQSFQDAMSVLADDTASAEEKTRALKQAIDDLNGVQPDLIDSQRDSNEAMLDAKDMWKDAEGNVVSYKKAIEKSTGVIKLGSREGIELSRSLEKVKDTTLQTAISMDASGESVGNVNKYLKNQRNAWADASAASLGGRDVALRVYDEMMGANPGELTTLITANADGVPLTVEEVNRLLGELQGKRTVAEITADKEGLAGKILEAKGDLDTVDGLIATAYADLNPDELNAKKDQVIAALIELGLQNPTVGADMDPRMFETERLVVMNKIRELGRQKPTPEVIAETATAQGRLNSINSLLGIIDGTVARTSVVTTYETKFKSMPKPPGVVVTPGTEDGGISYGRGVYSKKFAPQFHAFADGGIVNEPLGGAKIYKPASQYRIFAEPQTGGEVFIPLSASKRKRSLQIWRETGRLLGAQEFADGGISNSSGGPTINVTNYYPVAEKTSTTVNRALQYASVPGLS